MHMDVWKKFWRKFRVDVKWEVENWTVSIPNKLYEGGRHDIPRPSPSVDAEAPHAAEHTSTKR